MPLQVLVGYDGSPSATTAIDVGARLFPQARAWIAHVWTPSFTGTGGRQRRSTGTRQVDELVEAAEREGEQEAERTAAAGVTLARAAGWDAEPLVVRSYGGADLQLTDLAEKMNPDLVLVGSRGLSGGQAVLGSVSDLVVHYALRPVLVVPHRVLIAEYAAVASGPVVAGFDGSAGARAALATAAHLFPTRNLVAVSVEDGRQVRAEPPHAGDAAVTHVRVSGGRGASARAVAGALAACARDRGAAALVVGSRGRSAVREILLGSVAMATLHHADRPVLVTPAAGRGRPDDG